MYSVFSYLYGICLLLFVSAINFFERMVSYRFVQSVQFSVLTFFFFFLFHKENLFSRGFIGVHYPCVASHINSKFFYLFEYAFSEFRVSILYSTDLHFRNNFDLIGSLTLFETRFGTLLRVDTVEQTLPLRLPTHFSRYVMTNA